MFNSPLPSVGFLFAFYATVAARIGKRTCRPNGIISITLSPVLYVFFYNQQVLWLRNRISHSSRFCLKKKKPTVYGIQMQLMLCTFKQWVYCMQCKRLCIFICFSLKVEKKEMREKVILYPIFNSLCLSKVCNNVAVYMQMMLIRRFLYQLCQRLHSLYTLNLHLKRAVIINI